MDSERAEFDLTCAVEFPILKNMDQTPVHDHHNPDLLALIPADSSVIVEVGCSSGALAREFKRINPHCRYIGVEVEPNYAKLAQRYCDNVYELDIESVDEPLLKGELACDCWIFGDSLEHLKNPWGLLEKIREVIPAHGSIVACIPNAQHWSVQARLCCGEFRYERSGLMDKTHLRWFTRKTIFEMFNSAGFQIADGASRIFPEPDRDKYLPAIKALAACTGTDPEIAAEDALPIQYVIRATPA